MLDDEKTEDELNLDLVTETAKSHFGIKYLYPWQRLVIANILDAADAIARADKAENAGDLSHATQNPADDELFDEDGAERGKQIVLLPTGAGKSLCFMVPAILLSAPTLILYPLLALMTDQQRRIEEGGMNAVVFRGGQTAEEREENFRQIESGAKIILANPEVLQSDNLTERLAKIGIAHIAIDEAHCVSEWGDSFRPAYLTCGEIIKKLKCKLITAFTATASPEVLSRVAEVLFDGKAHLVRGESDRENLRYRVVQCYNKDVALIKAVAEAEKPCVVFCSTRKRTESVARNLREYYSQLCPEEDLVRFYHAGLSKPEKDAVEKWFHPHPNGIMVCTCAWGMGVDKKNIRTVIHRDAPQTAEAFIQESGRGGRDGEIAKSVLLWSPEDTAERKDYPENSRQIVMHYFATKGTCRRRILLDALADPDDELACSGCDVCDGTVSNTAEDADFALKTMRHNKKRFRLGEASEYLSQKANKTTLKTHGAKLWNESDFTQIIKSLIKEGNLHRNKFPWKGRISCKCSPK